MLTGCVHICLLAAGVRATEAVGPTTEEAAG